MIKELRIGNYVRSNTTPSQHVLPQKSYYDVAEIRENKCMLNHYPSTNCDTTVNQRSPQDATTHLDSVFIEPIPINEAWLLKFGFLTNRLGADKKELALIKDNRFMNGYRMHGRDTKILHVHSLQNLYFALTGTELEIKPS